MKLSTKIRYGLRAILQIAMEGESKPIMARQIAERQNISEPYIDQLLIPLRTNGLIRSFRGRRGGYQMAADPKELTVLNIVESLNGRLNIMDCLDDNECDRKPRCATKVIWEQANENLRQSLDSTTLKELVQRELELNRSPDFAI